MKLLHAYKRPKTSIVVICIITIFFAWYLPKLVINNDVIVFLPKNNPHRVALDALKREFTGSDGIIVAATVKEGFIYSQKNVAALKAITDSLSIIDSIDDVTSLTTTDYVQGVEGGLETVPIAGYIPQNSNEELLIRERLENWNIYENTLYTGDYKTSLILLRLKNNSIKRDEMVYRRALAIIAPYKDVFDFRIAGSPAVFILAGENMTSDLTRLIPFVILVVLATLWFSFRRPGGIILPLLTVVISIIWALGLMSLLGVEVTLIATVIPVLLVAIGSAYGIHILSHYFDAYAEAPGGISEKAHEQLLDGTINDVGKPVMLAALTTMAGFGSLATSKITPVHDFGVFTCVGVFSAFIVSIVLIPSILHFIHGKRSTKPEKNAVNPLIDPIVHAFENTSRHPKIVLTAALLVIVVSFFGVTKVHIGNAIVNFFKNTSTLWQANNWLQNNTNGTTTLSIVIHGEAAGDAAQPGILKIVDDFGTQITATHRNVTKVGSLVDVIKRINVVMHVEEIAADPSISYDEIPTVPEKYGMTDADELHSLISQYLMLFTGDIKQFADDGIEPKNMRVIMQINTNDIDSLKAIKKSAEQWLNAHMVEPFTWEISGTADAEIEVNRLIVNSQIYSILTSIVIVFIIMAFAYGSPWAGLYSALCIALPLLINFSVMGFLHIPLDVATAMVSSISIGIGIDYIIHYMSAYRRELRSNQNMWNGVSIRTVRSCGKAIIYNAVSVAFGFSVIFLSNFKPLTYLGSLIFLSMLTSSLVSLTILPVLFDTFKPSFLLYCAPGKQPTATGGLTNKGGTQ